MQPIGATTGCKTHGCHSLPARIGVKLCNMEHNKEYATLAELVKAKRKELGLSQADLADAMNRSRHWVIQLEKGEWYGVDREFTLEAEYAVKLARVLDVNPREVLTLGKVPKIEWPDLSYTLSNGDTIQAIDITDLTDEQAALIRQLVHELAKGKSDEPRQAGRHPTV